MIMGCLLVDIIGIVSRVRETIGDKAQMAALASELWSDTQNRECRLAAPMLFPASLMTADEALMWCQSVETIEVADNLCHKLLRHIDGAEMLFRQLIDDGKVQLNDSLRAIVEHESTQTSQGPLALLLKDILEEVN